MLTLPRSVAWLSARPTLTAELVSTTLASFSSFPFSLGLALLALHLTFPSSLPALPFSLAFGRRAFAGVMAHPAAPEASLPHVVHLHLFLRVHLVHALDPLFGLSVVVGPVLPHLVDLHRRRLAHRCPVQSQCHDLVLDLLEVRLPVRPLEHVVLELVRHHRRQQCQLNLLVDLDVVFRVQLLHLDLPLHQSRLQLPDILDSSRLHHAHHQPQRSCRRLRVESNQQFMPRFPSIARNPTHHRQRLPRHQRHDQVVQLRRHFLLVILRCLLEDLLPIRVLRGFLDLLQQIAGLVVHRPDRRLELECPLPPLDRVAAELVNPPEVPLVQVARIVVLLERMGQRSFDSSLDHRGDLLHAHHVFSSRGSQQQQPAAPLP